MPGFKYTPYTLYIILASYKTFLSVRFLTSKEDIVIILVHNSGFAKNYFKE